MSRLTIEGSASAFWVIVILAILVIGGFASMAGCESETPRDDPTSVPSVGPIPSDVPPDPTPTQEVVEFGTGCISDLEAELLVNPNPCLEGISYNLLPLDENNVVEVPQGYEIVYHLGVSGNLWARSILDEQYIIDLTYADGYYGYAIPQLPIDSGFVYQVIVNGTSTVNVDDWELSSETFDFRIQVHRSYQDDVVILSEPLAVDAIWGPGYPYRELAGERNFTATFCSSFPALQLVRLEIEILSMWPLGLHGSTFRFDRILVLKFPGDDSCVDIN